jgi:hypothetical protein
MNALFQLMFNSSLVSILFKIAVISAIVCVKAYTLNDARYKYAH